MRCGLFGKLPAKRDFIAVTAPREFLRLWEPWLEKGLAHGMAQHSPQEWKAAFGSAPIWRFWLGPALCGRAIVGAVMPSADALGRLFPLTVIGMASGDETLDPPDLDPREAWFAEAEDFLLAALDPETSLETTAEALEGLGATASPAPHLEAVAAMRPEQLHPARETATFWWTIGGGDRPALAFMQKSMPEPATFADMLTRRMDDRPGLSPCSDMRLG